MHRRRGLASAAWTAALVLIAQLVSGNPAGADTANDANTGRDAADTFASATRIHPRGYYSGNLDRAGGDRHDVYRFHLDEGESVSVLITVPVSVTDPVTILDPNGVVVDTGMRFAPVGVAASGAFTQQVGYLRLAVHKAVVAGDYRLHLRAENHDVPKYELCFLNCEGTVDQPIQFIFGGSLLHTDTSVLLVPPAHGDLGNPFGPTVLDYLDATLKGIHGWVDAMDAFARDYPQFSYLRDITVDIEVFDEANPVDPAGFDIVIGYVAAGPVFRGVASGGISLQEFFRDIGLGDDVHFSGRVIALSLFGSAPRAGQVLYDFPEYDDLHAVTLHEFGHTFGLGHTTTRHPVYGPDLMNSPAPFIYGDGFPAGDGGERTGRKCLSSLDLYGMAMLYRWIPDGRPVRTFGSVRLPKGIPYKLYC